MGYLTASNKQFFLNGNRFIFTGGTTYNAGTSPVHELNTTYINTIISNAKTFGFNTLRFINMFGSNTSYASITSEAFWTEIDYALDQCRQNGIKALFDLSDFGQMEKQTFSLDPYQQDWHPWVSFVLNRTNTVNSLKYSNDDTILMWIIYGEPDASYNSELVSFYSGVSTYIKSIDSNHLVCPGAIASYNPYTSISAISTLDTIPISYYDLTTITTAYATISAAANAIGKPFFVQEFGTAQSGGDLFNANLYRNIFDLSQKNNSQGFIIWNMGAYITPNSLDLNPIFPETTKIMNIISKITGYCPRIPLYAV